MDDGDALVQVQLQAASTGTLWNDDGGGGGTAGDGVVNGNEAAVVDDEVIALADITKLQWAPAANTNGATYATFSFKVHDGDAYSANRYVKTFAVTAINDPPTLTATSSDATHTEDGSAASLYSGSAAGSGGAGGTAESDEIDKLTIQITNVQDTTENIVFDGSTIPISTAGTGTTTTNELDWTVTRSSTTSTLAFDADGGSFTTAELVTALDAATYTNTDQSPTAGARVITITLLEDEGSSSSPHDNSANSGLAQATTITIAGANDAPTVANAQSDGTATEDVAYSYTTPSNTFADVDSGDSCTYTSTQTDASALPGWLTFTPSTRVYSGTPAVANVGTLNIRTTCTDGSNAAVNDDWDLVISALNAAPVHSSDGSGSATAGSVVEDSALSITLTATDEENSDVTYAAGSTFPGWVTLTDGGGGAMTATLTADASAITDARVGETTCLL